MKTVILTIIFINTLIFYCIGQQVMQPDTTINYQKNLQNISTKLDSINESIKILKLSKEDKLLGLTSHTWVIIIAFFAFITSIYTFYINRKISLSNVAPLVTFEDDIMFGNDNKLLYRIFKIVNKGKGPATNIAIEASEIKNTKPNDIEISDEFSNQKINKVTLRDRVKWLNDKNNISNALGEGEEFTSGKYLPILKENDKKKNLDEHRKYIDATITYEDGVGNKYETIIKKGIVEWKKKQETILKRVGRILFF